MIKYNSEIKRVYLWSFFNKENLRILTIYPFSLSYHT